MNMKHEAELTTHIIHQLNFEFTYIFTEAMSKLASLSKPKPYLPMHLYYNTRGPGHSKSDPLPPYDAGGNTGHCSLSISLVTGSGTSISPSCSH